mmetsp:Transcript_2978/g.8391  ORF Transcript_2978/g.8391 Transcript_2978/m.8391 type:complete len:343 (-) Transcript_2978:166-1194(-)
MTGPVGPSPSRTSGTSWQPSASRTGASLWCRTPARRCGPQPLPAQQHTTGHQLAQLTVLCSALCLGTCQLNQTGDGHYSPVGGYHAGKDMVLLLDVARFKYPPHWVPVEVLYNAMLLEDSATGSPRGYFVVRPTLQPSLLLVCNRRFPRWKEALDDTLNALTTIKAAQDSIHEGENIAELSSLPEPIQAALQKLPLDQVFCFLEPRSIEVEGCQSWQKLAGSQLKELLNEIRKLHLFKLIGQFLKLKGDVLHISSSLDPFLPERLLILMLMASAFLSEEHPHGWDSRLLDMSPSGQQLLTAEVVYLLHQLSTLSSSVHGRTPEGEEDNGATPPPEDARLVQA